jgi:hypothetical protein
MRGTTVLRSWCAAVATIAICAACAGGDDAGRDRTSPSETVTSAARHSVSGGCGGTSVYRGAPPAWARPDPPRYWPYVISDSGLIAGFLFGYPLRAGDRVAQQGRSNKILWWPKLQSETALRVEARPLGAQRPVIRATYPGGGIYPDGLDVPKPGCWRFTLSWGRHTDTVHLRYLPPVVPAALRRPLRRVQMPPGCCEVTKPTHSGLAGIWGPAQGRGPVYPISERGILPVEFPPDPDWIFAGTGYGVAKVIWVAEPSYDGPVLIRGLQIGGPHRVRFTGQSSTDEPLGFATEAVARPDASKYRWQKGWRELKTLRMTAVRVPGCYAWQVDGIDFSYTIVFKVVDSTD